VHVVLDPALKILCDFCAVLFGHHLMPYGDVALASDRRTRKLVDASGKHMEWPHRALLIFVKQNGQWHSAGGALVPIMSVKN
jgi:ketosteroid isomerase-like protein